MTDPSSLNTVGQIEGLGVMAVTLTVATAVRARRTKIRRVRKLRALRKLSGVRPTVGHLTAQDRSER